MSDESSFKPVVWIGSSLKDLREFPAVVQDHMGYALYVAQQGGKHRDTKTLTGFGGAGVVEIIKDYRGDTFRAVYTLRDMGACLRATRLPEEIKNRSRNAAPRHGISEATASRSGSGSSGEKLTMSKNDYEIGGRNVFRGSRDSECGRPFGQGATRIQDRHDYEKTRHETEERSCRSVWRSPARRIQNASRRVPAVFGGTPAQISGEARSGCGDRREAPPGERRASCLTRVIKSPRNAIRCRATREPCSPTR